MLPKTIKEQETDTLLDMHPKFRRSGTSEDLVVMSSPASSPRIVTRLAAVKTPSLKGQFLDTDSLNEDEDDLYLAPAIPGGIPLVASASRTVAGYLGGLGIGALLLGNRRASGESQRAGIGQPKGLSSSENDRPE